MILAGTRDDAGAHAGSSGSPAPGVIQLRAGSYDILIGVCVCVCVCVCRRTNTRQSLGRAPTDGRHVVGVAGVIVALAALNRRHHHQPAAAAFG